MKKRLFTLVAAGSTIAALAIPASALASHGCGHGIVASNTTSCGIARNADTIWHRDAYGDAFAQGNLWSPATHRMYHTTCLLTFRTGRVTCYIDGRGNPWAKFWW